MEFSFSREKEGGRRRRSFGGAFFSRKCDGGGGKIKGGRWKRSGFGFVNGGEGATILFLSLKNG